MAVNQPWKPILRKMVSSNILSTLSETSANQNLRFLCSSNKLVDVAVNDKTGVATVTMQRPPVNSLNLDLLQSLANTFDQLEENKCRGMILTSASPTVFSAGLDLMEMYKPNQERVQKFWSSLQDVWIKLFGSPYPTVAAINGHSPAGGCLLALSCEYRVMVGPKFTIGLNETKLGIVAPGWFQDSMKNTISGRDAELALTMGTMFSTDEALNIGLIDETATDKADAIAKAESFLAKTAKIPATARRLTKMTLRQKVIDRLANNRETDLEIFLTFVNQKAVQKGIEMYLESLKQKA